MTIGNLGIKVFRDKLEAARQAAEDIRRSLSVIRRGGGKALFLSSGGSSLAILDFIDEDVLADYLTIGVLDERYDVGGGNNNFLHLARTGFYARALASGCSFIDTRVRPGQTQRDLAGHFEGELRAWRKGNPGGYIIATVGIGPDGHTSGIMPFPEDRETFDALFNGDRWVVSYNAAGKTPFPERVTTTNTFLRMISRAIVYATGAEKAEALRRLEEDVSLAEVPAAVMKELDGTVYIDRELAEVAKVSPR